MATGKRRKAREIALQFLYQLDQHGAADPAPHAGDFWERHPVAPDTRRYAEELVRGATRRHDEIDAIIAQCAERWDLERMAVVDRNILRLAVYELLWEPAVPPKVVINEAIEIAKKFGTGESGRFINGVLDRILKEHRAASA
ncbi:MAG TPA: transcription antitermination factor NusB [Candidatus Tectomicrobia bacterium]|nr:transcription antitermination factor NusB [Candidatus Tectomicrobia bacterium]